MVTWNGSETLPTTPPFSGSGPDTGDTRTISVLYVDDTPALANLICMYLDRDGEMMVDTSLSVEEAMNKMRYICYDVIVTDYNNKEEKGIELLRNVRAKGGRIPFVYFVLFRVAMYEDDAKQLGQVSFVEKLGNSATNFNKLRQVILQAVREDRNSAVLRADQSASRPDDAVRS
jgi:DNA-binding NtrC family response regulator